jgi:hypothetical protein
MTEDRAAEMRTWAEAHGFEYGADVPEEILSLPFYLFTLGQDGPVVTGEHMLTGDWNGMPVDLFDVNVPVADGVQILGITQYWTENEVITTAMAGTGARLPYVYIEKKDRATRFADDLDRVDHLHHDHDEVECGAKDFDKHFDVKAADADFARALIDHTMMESLVAQGSGFVYEVSGWQFVVHTPKDAHDLGALLDATKAFWDNIPSEVVEKYAAAAEGDG